MVKPHNTYDCKWNWISKLYDFLFWKRHYRIIYSSMIYWIWNNIFCWLSYNGVIYQIYKLESLTVGFFFLTLDVTLMKQEKRQLFIFLLSFLFLHFISCFTFLTTISCVIHFIIAIIRSVWKYLISTHKRSI